MKTSVAVARREIVEKRFIFWVALGIAAQPFLVPIVRGLAGQTAREVRDITAIFAGLGMGAAIAAGLGSSIFAGELAARRMGFYFSKPISSLSLWAGKVAGALLLTLTAFAVALPVMLVDGPSGISRALPVDILVLGLLLVPLFLVTSAAATVIRSRSRLALVDLVASIVVSLIWVWVAGRFNREASIGVYTQLWVLAAIVVVAFGAASLRSVTRGRTDFAAVHATLSATLWVLLAAPAVALAAYLAWATAAPATALAKISSASALGHTGWITVWGSARGLQGSYLYEPRTGRSQRLPRESYLSVSPDGKMAAWLEAESQRKGPWTLFTLDLANPGSRPIETKVVPTNPDWPLALSPDGSRVATVNYGILAVHEIASGRLLLSAPIGAKLNWALPWFTGSDRVRVLGVSSEKAGRRVVISAEADLASRSLGITGTAEDVKSFAFGPEQELVLLRRGTDLPREVCDARTLRPIATLADDTHRPLPWSGTAFLGDRIVMGGSDEKASWLDVLSQKGAPLRTIPVGESGHVRIGGEPHAGELFVSLERKAEHPGQPTASSIYLVDLERGTSRKVAEGLQPIVWWFWGTAPAPGSEGTSLFLSADQKLVRLDPVTGERRVLLGGR